MRAESSARPTQQGGRSSARRVPARQAQASSSQNLKMRGARVSPPCGSPRPRHSRPAHVHSSGPPLPGKAGDAAELAARLLHT